MQIKIKTPKHELNIKVYYDSINSNNIKVDKKLFVSMCQKGCKNYGNKYSCPPFSPSFNEYVKKDKLFAVMLLLKLNQFDNFNYKEYHKLRIANAVIKPRIEKIMRELEKITKTKFLSTGACRLCKPCQKKINKPCKHPDKMRFSMEALGVDCNDLALKLFKKPLLWYKKKDKLEYTAVICAIPYENKCLNSLRNLIKNIKKKKRTISLNCSPNTEN